MQMRFGLSSFVILQIHAALRITGRKTIAALALVAAWNERSNAAPSRDAGRVYMGRVRKTPKDRSFEELIIFVLP